jgi:D-arabinose 1-dehydrogenase-like Zn-dependent alcohol dehydrogenase
LEPLGAGADGARRHRSSQTHRAVARRAHVIATASTDLAFVKEHGAADVVDYRGDLAAAVREKYPRGVDAVLDFAGGGAELVANAQTPRPDGIDPRPDPRAARPRGGSPARRSWRTLAVRIDD